MEQLLNLRDLLDHQVEDLTSAEDQIIEALPAMIENAKDGRLKKALNEHLQVTKEHRKRLDKIKQLLGTQQSEDAEGKTKSFLERIFGGGTKCKGMEGLLTEGEKVIKEDMDAQVKDAAIIAAAQKVEHYEISGYGTARAYAAQLKLDVVEKLLNSTLNEEYQADDLLTALALGKVNLEAERGGNAARRGNNRANGRAQATKPPARAAKKSAVKKKSARKKAAKKKGAKKAARRR
jgi:ferritin-like metal-binding protein YciE